MRGAFTLLETLAAVVLLGVLAAASVPLMLDMGRAASAAMLRHEMGQLMRTAPLPDGAMPAGRWPVAGHPGCWWRVVALQAGARSSSAAGVLPTDQPHRWVQISITLGDGPGAPILADRLALVMGVSAPPGTP